MMFKRSILVVIFVLLLALLLPGCINQVPAVQGNASTLEWLGWSHFRITSSEGKVILINPFITGNNDSIVKLEDITKADLILVADGHGDEGSSDAIPLVQKTGAK